MKRRLCTCVYSPFSYIRLPLNYKNRFILNFISDKLANMTTRIVVLSKDRG
jgi:hypothetical protein